MARNKNALTVVEEPRINEPRLVQTEAAAGELAIIDQKKSAQVTALARQLNYEGSTDPAVLENSARECIRRAGIALFEFGGYLLLLREASGHGQFLPALERLGIDPRSAQQYMKVTKKFASGKSATVSHLQDQGIRKLLEMATLDDEQVEEMIDLGQTGELALDDVAKMSVKQLREAVRKERLVKGRLEEVNRELNTELALKRNLKVAATDWPERFKGLLDQAEVANRAIRTAVDHLEAVRAAALEDDAESPEDEGSLQRARETLADLMVRNHRACAERLDALGAIFDKTLGAFASEGLYQ